MNVCNYIPTKYLDDKGYNLRLRLLFKEVCFLKGAGGTGVLTIVAGTGISVNSTDPQNPIVTATGGAAPISSLTAAVASNSIDNVAHLQLWEWNSLTSGNGLQLNSSSTLRTGTGSQLLRVYVSGANAASGITSIAIAGSNVSSGTNSTAIGGLFSATGGATKNIGAQFSATGGTNNYALIVPSGGGNVGINTSTPAVALDVVGAATVSTSLTTPIVKLSTTLFWSAGTGSPEGVVTADVGSLYSRTDGAPSLYVKETGTGNTGWTPK